MVCNSGVGLGNIVGGEGEKGEEGTALHHTPSPRLLLCLYSLAVSVCLAIKSSRENRRLGKWLGCIQGREREGERERER